MHKGRISTDQYTEQAVQHRPCVLLARQCNISNQQVMMRSYRGVMGSVIAMVGRGIVQCVG
ncbi:hypothetical protein ABIA06_001795 [Bradyrhizobium yuanmingense]